MKQEVRHHPSVKQLVQGTIAFDRTVNLTTFVRMTRALVRTALNRKPHSHMNQDQNDILSGLQQPWTIILLVPGFQLDGVSMLGMKRAINARGIPALFPEDLPYGRKAFFYRQHPDQLVNHIVQYTKSIRARYPWCHLLLVWHSYGGAQVVHAAHQLISDETSPGSKVIPVSVSGTLSPIGLAADALHALYYRTPSDVFSGRDPFINKAGELLQSNAQGIIFVDPYDQYLSVNIQTGGNQEHWNNPNVIISDRWTSPGHYHQWANMDYSAYVINEVLERAQAILESTQP